ncbi:hypothetical protein AB4Y96_18480 [Phyllobacterium sp. TAF24]|uniref:hypothetical protein n=1 Tax=unclassified Phyllobacterium TaxID=2638441 RepID=UPI00088279CE|nr:hypothetical protein [Phyllobacterium sp. OV277]SDN85311.1 hypothetical protein SAMN05443582_101317 [Phyllobacterium sp. OV277]
MKLNTALIGLVLVSSGLLVSACQTSDQSITRTGSTVYAVSTKAGQQVLLTNVYKINPDCSTTWHPTLKVVSGPQHGTVKITRSSIFPAFGAGHALHKCNSRRASAVAPVYTPAPGFVGTDTIDISSTIMGDNRSFDYYSFRITVTN